jgi:hypothetical protein
MTGSGLAGRRRARLLLGLILLLDVVLASLFAAQPDTIGPLFDAPPSLLGLPLGTLIVTIGIGLHLAGLAWMIRIIRADPEAQPNRWRGLRR